MKIRIVLFFVLFSPVLNCFGSDGKADSLLDVLKTEIQRAHLYDQRKELRIENLKHQLTYLANGDIDSKFKIYNNIFEEYRSFKFDSAYACVSKMVALAERYNNRDIVIKGKILQGSILLSSGLYKEAFDVADKIDTAGLSAKVKSDFYILRARLNASIGDYDHDPFFSDRYYKQSAADFKNAETAEPSNDFEKTINLAFNPDSVNKRKLTPEFFYNVIMNRHLTPHGIAMVATRVSYAYTGKNRIMFLALAAISDIRSSTKETMAIFLLGQELFKVNQIQEAYLLVQEAVKNAKFYGARSREIQIEAILPLVAGKMVDDQQHDKDKLVIGILIFSIIAVVLFFLLFIYRKQMLRTVAHEQAISKKNKELEILNDKLWESSRIKEEFIGLFFKTCSSYLEIIDKMKRKAQHYIKLGRYDDVNSLLDKVKIEKEKTQLYDTLDSMFTTLFPNFISSFNTLLKKEDQIWPRDNESLNATLRIFALMRLGVHENEAIAKILDYSVSTVYTYKVRVKSKALVDADEFEQKIMEIKFSGFKPAVSQVA